MSVVTETGLATLFPNRLPIYEKDDTIYKSLTGHEFKPLGKITIRVDHAKAFSAIVIKEMAHNLILGMDALKQGQFKLSSNSMIWYGRKYKLFPYCNKDVNKYIGVFEETPEQQQKINELLNKYDSLFSEKAMPQPLKTALFENSEIYLFVKIFRLRVKIQNF